jgi:hypothetical protein
VNPLVTAVAIQRTTQLVTEDVLTQPIRDAVNNWAKGHPDGSFRDRIATLSQCPACMSVWVTGGVLLASRFAVGRVLVHIMAGSGAALIVQAGIKRLERP